MKIRECVLSDLILVSRFSCEDGGIEREVMKERDWGRWDLFAGSVSNFLWRRDWEKRRRKGEWWIDWEWEHRVTQTCCDGGIAWWRDKETGPTQSVKGRNAKGGKGKTEGGQTRKWCYFLISLQYYGLTFLAWSREPLCKRTVTTWPDCTGEKCWPF